MHAVLFLSILNFDLTGCSERKGKKRERRGQGSTATAFFGYSNKILIRQSVRVYFRLANEVFAWRQSNSKRNRKFNILGKRRLCQPNFTWGKVIKLKLILLWLGGGKQNS